MDARWIDTVDVAKILRAEIKRAYPRVKFSVRSERFSLSSSISVSWTDGPHEREVSQRFGGFSGSSYDGRTDSTTYHDSEWNGEPVHFGNTYLSFTRHMSDTRRAEIVAAIEQATGRPFSPSSRYSADDSIPGAIRIFTPIEGKWYPVGDPMCGDGNLLLYQVFEGRGDEATDGDPLTVVTVERDEAPAICPEIGPREEEARTAGVVDTQACADGHAPESMPDPDCTPQYRITFDAAAVWTDGDVALTHELVARRMGAAWVAEHIALGADRAKRREALAVALSWDGATPETATPEQLHRAERVTNGLMFYAGIAPALRQQELGL